MLVAVLGVAVYVGVLSPNRSQCPRFPQDYSTNNGGLPHEERLWRLNRYIANMGTNRRHAIAQGGKRSRVRRFRT